jgi:site-specific DNA recombinase
MNSGTRAAIYVRQSLDVQEGIDRQISKCKSLASARGWEVVETYEDNDTSASKARGSRTAWSRMLHDAKQKKFDAVIAVDVDRLVRRIEDLGPLGLLGVNILTVDRELDISTTEGELMGSIMAIIARYEVRHKADRQRRANAHRASLGIPTAGKRPFGFEKDRMALRENEAKWVRWMHDEFLGGTSLHSIARQLNEKLVPTSQGKTWSTSQVKSILMRARNAGFLTHLGVIQLSSKIQPIIEVDVHESVVAALRNPSRGITAGPKSELNWLNGVLRCSVCASPMRGKRVTPSKGGPRKRYYICATKEVRTNMDGQRHVTISAEIAEETVQMKGYSYFSSGSYAIAPKAEKDITRIRKEMRENETERHALTEDLLVRGVARDVIKKRLVGLALLWEKLSDSLAMYTSDDNDFDSLAMKLRLDEQDSAEAALQWYMTWNGLPVERRRAILNHVFVITIVKGGKGSKRVHFELVKAVAPDEPSLIPAVPTM